MTGEVERMSGLGEAIMEQTMQRGLEQGRELGLQQGREQGLQQGRELGLQQGRELEIVISVKEGDYSPERGAEKLGCSLEEFKKKMELSECWN